MASGSGLIGQTLGRYHILEQIGAGGMGVVYRARDERLERDVALKVLTPGTLADENARRRFRKEALALSRLNHPNIATVHDFDTHQGLDLLVTELVAGMTLDRKVADGALPEKEVVEIGMQLADGLQAAHQLGVAHRDLKPSNLRLTSEGRVKILDFGLAANVGAAGEVSITHSAADSGLVGTLAYMAPEQLRGDKLDARCDLWGAGAVLYELATGSRAFDGRTATAITDKILHGAVTPPRQLQPRISSRLADIIDKCLEKDPENRYQSAKELLVDLRRMISPASATVTLPAPRASRLKSVTIPVVLLLFIAVALGVWRVGLRMRQPEAPAEALVIKPLTSFVGMEWGVTLSPDAGFIAYGHNRYGHMDMFVLPTSGGDPIRLTDNPADELTARWSPDGRYIAFVSDRGTGANVYLIPPLGGAERKLVETNIPWFGREVDALQSVGAMPWSPDGRELVFSRLHPTGAIALWKVNLGTGAQTQLTRPEPGVLDLYASWSFDGKRMVFGRQGGGKDGLWLLDAHGGEPELLLSDRYMNMGPAWLPDSQRLLFLSNRGGGAMNLWESDTRSRRLRQVTSGSGNALLPAVSATGRVAYTQYSHQVDIYWGLVGRPQEEHQRLTSHTFNNFGARVSPDGQHVLYFSDRAGNYDLWLLNRRTGAERQLTDHPGPDFMGDWSPDGREIVFLSGREGSVQVWVLTAESGRVRRLSERSRAVSFEPHFSGPRWSPDGKAVGFIAAGEKDLTLFIVDPQGGNERSPLPGVTAFDWYRDSLHVLYTRSPRPTADGSEVSEMRVADLQSGKEVLLLRGPTVEMVVARDGRGVAYLHAASHFNMQLTLLRLAPPASADGLPRPLGTPQQLTRGEGNWHVHNGGWSPDGKAIVYTRDADSGDVYVIQNYR